MSNHHTSPGPDPSRRKITIAVLVMMAALYAITIAAQWGDTEDYINDILIAHNTGRIGPLFEFGHLLWRPLGLAIYLALPAKAFGWQPEFAGHLAFLLPVLISGLVCAVLFGWIASAASRSTSITLLTVSAFLCCNAFLNWSQAGMSYVPGLCFLSAAVWILIRAAGRGTLPTASVIFAGFLLALSILFWFPYITVSAGCAVILLVWPSTGTPIPLQTRIRQTVLLALVTVAFVGITYFIGFRLNGFSHPAEVATWMKGASHGMHSGSVVRFLFGFPRSFIDMGHDGILFKRYLLHDPYASVSLLDLLGTTVLRLALFYLFLGYVLFRLLSTRGGRPIFWTLLAAGVPLLFFAIVLFESGSTERYFPLFPFLILAVAFALDGQQPRAGRIAATVLLIAASLTQIWGLSRLRVTREDDQVAASLRQTGVAGGAGALIWVPITSDPALSLANDRPFDPINQPHSLPVRQVILPGSDQSAAWRMNFAKATLQAFDRGAPVWISNRLLAPRPKPEWLWTEGDVPGVSWHDLPDYFSRLELSGSTTGGEAFSQVAPTASNRTILNSSLQTP